MKSALRGQRSVQAGSQATARRTSVLFRLAVLGCFLVMLPSCAGALSAAGAGVAVALEFVGRKPACKTLCHGFAESKKALLVALCRMEIAVQGAQQIERGERILARANALEITIDLERITARVTSMSVMAKKGVLALDMATAEEIIRHTGEIAQKLEGVSLASRVPPPAFPETQTPESGREVEGFSHPHAADSRR